MAADPRRVGLGHFVRPGAETPDGRPRREALHGYLVPLGERYLLVDTGFGPPDAEVDAHYRPTRTTPAAALAAVGVRMDEVALILNCHLHFDHCGGNPAFAGVPILVQAAELAAARAGAHTDPALVDFPGARYEVLDGDAEIAPGCTVLATPGHTLGHQSLLLARADGPILVAGQTHDTASQFTADALAARLGTPSGAEPPPAWLDRVLGLGIVRAVFAHDAAVWFADEAVRVDDIGRGSDPRS